MFQPAEKDNIFPQELNQVLEQVTHGGWVVSVLGKSQTQTESSLEPFGLTLFWTGCTADFRMSHPGTVLLRSCCALFVTGAEQMFVGLESSCAVRDCLNKHLKP